MEIRQLRYFMAVVEHGSFSRAAADLGRTQQAISKAVHALEEALGVRLLDRNAQVVAPTAFGKLLLEHAQAIEGEMNAFRAQLSQLVGAESGAVRIGTGPTTAGGLVAEAVLDLQRRKPQLRLEVLSGIQPDLINDLQQGRLDLAVCIETENLDVGALVREVLAHDDCVVVCGAGHPLASRPSVSIADLASAQWVIGRGLGEVERAWMALFDEAGIARPESVIGTNSLKFCRVALERDEYLTVLPRGLIEADLAAGSLRVIAMRHVAWTRPISLLYRRGNLRTPALLAVIDALYARAERVPI